MHTALRHTSLCLSLLLLLLTISCQQEISPLPQAAEKGRIVLSLSDPAAYIDVQTRAEHPLENISDYDFTLSGTTAEGVAVVNQPITLTDGTAVFDAGTYTIAVRGNSTLAAAAVTGLGTPYYEGASVDNTGNATSFTIEPGGLTSVKVLLRPANAKLTINLTTAFTSNYRNVTFTVGSRVVALLTDNTAPTTDTQEIAYFPTGNLTVAATARKGSLVTEIIPVTDAIILASGTNNTITLTANPVTGEIIPIVSGEHSGEFD